MAKLETITLSPKETKLAIGLTAAANISLFIWGPPGIGKSELTRSIATDNGVAFIDIRLSQMDPTDVRGMPYKVEESGVTTGVAWSPPLSFPRDIDESFIREIPNAETVIKYDKLNLLGVNGIPYVREPNISVESLTEGLTAEIVTLSESQIAEKTEDNPYFSAQEFTVRLVDVNGKVQSGRVKYSIKGKAAAIMGFEEMNSAPPSVLAACYQIILDRRCGEYIVPKDVSIVAMGNREDDRGVTFKMPAPLINRFDHIEMKADHNEWLEWAIEKKVSPSVIGYVGAFSEQLMTKDIKAASRAFPTPRSWYMVSKVLGVIAQNKNQYTGMTQYAVLSGLVGDATAAQFTEFMKIAESLPKPEDILTGKITKLVCEPDNKVALSYQLTTTLLYVLGEENSTLLEKETVDAGAVDRKEFNERLNTWIDFSMNNFKPEIFCMAMARAMKSYNISFNRKKLPAFSVFLDKYADLLNV